MKNNVEPTLFDAIAIAQEVTVKNDLEESLIYEALSAAKLLKEKKYGLYYQIIAIFSYYSAYLDYETVHDFFETSEYDSAIYGLNLDMQHTLLVFARNACKNSIGCNVTGARVLSYLKAMKVGYNDTEFASVTLTNVMNNIFPYLRNSGCVFCDDICKECTRIFEEVKVQMYKKRV